MARTSLPPGFRFHPTDVELVKYYLKRKLMGKKLRVDAIAELNIYKYSPWDLPDKSCLRSKDLEWYFFCPKERKYASGARTNRATEIGYWKATGKDRAVLYNEQTVGMVKTLVFHLGHAPKGERTDWVMYEYRMEDKELADAGVVQDAYVLCKVFQKSGPGPKNGAQYGAPFNEEDWDDDEEICPETLPSYFLPPPLPCNEEDSVVTRSMFEPGSTSNSVVTTSMFEFGSTSNSVATPSMFELGSTSNSVITTSMFEPGSTSSAPLSEAGPSNVLPSVYEVPPPIPNNDEGIISLLDAFTEDVSLLPDHNGNNEVHNSSNENNREDIVCWDGNEMYDGLGDLGNWAELSGGGFSTEYGLHPGLTDRDLAFLELNDLNSPFYPPYF